MESLLTDRRKLKKFRLSSISFDLGVFFLGIAIIYYIIVYDKALYSVDGDLAPLSYSLYIRSFNSIKEGFLPLWNPSVWNGFPAYAHPTTEALYPVNWLMCLLFYNKETGMVSYHLMTGNFIFHLSLFYISVYCLCIRLKTSRGAAAFAAIVATFNLSLLNMKMFSWCSATSTICYLPILLFFCVGIIEAKDTRCSRKNAIGLGITIGLTALISLSGLFFINVFFVALICCFRLAEMIAEKEYGKLKRYILHMILSVLIATLLAFPVILGEAKLVTRAARYVPERGFLYGTDSTVLTYEEFLAGGICSLNDFVNLIFGNSQGGQLSVMLIEIVFFVIGIAGNLHGYIKKYFIFSSIFCFLYSIGAFFPHLVYHIPLVNTIREPMFYACYLPFFAAIISARGVDAAYQSYTEKRKISGVVIAVIVVILILNIFGNNVLFPKERVVEVVSIAVLFTILLFFREKIKKPAIMKLIFFGAFLVSFSAEIIMVNSNLSRYRYSIEDATATVDEHTEKNQQEFKKLETDGQERFLGWLSTTWPANSGSVLKYNEIAGYHNLIIDKAVKTYLSPYIDLKKKCELQNIKYIFHTKGQDEERTSIFDGALSEKEQYAELELYTSYDSIEKETVTAYLTNCNLGSAWFVSNLKYYDSSLSDDEVLQLVSDTDLSTTACINIEETFQLDEITEGEKIELSDQNDNSVTYKVHANGKHLLVNASMLYPGWVAYIDGKKAQMIEANYVDRAVVIDEGDHLVSFRFEPKEATIYPYCMIFCTVIIIILLLPDKRIRVQRYHHQCA